MNFDEKLKAATALGEKMKAFIDSMECPEKPEIPDKVGNKWALAYDKDKGGFKWESVSDPNAEGTENNPIRLNIGMKVYEGFHYIMDNIKYIAKENSTLTETNFENFLERFNRK